MNVLRKLKTDEKVDALRQIPLFAPCTDGELKELSSLATEVAVSEGQVLCQEGEVGHEFFVLTHGTAEVTSAVFEPLALGPGDFFGELALLDDGTRVASVTMTSDGQVLVLSGSEFRRLLRAVPGIAVRMLSVLGDRLREAQSSRA